MVGVVISLTTPFTYTKPNDIMYVWEIHTNLQEITFVNFVIINSKDTEIYLQNIVLITVKILLKKIKLN